MKKIGITGQAGFIGSHLYNSLGLFAQKYERVEFEKSYIYDDTLLDQFVRQCDVIVHLAGVNRHADLHVVYNTNIDLAKRLVESIKRTKSSTHIIFSSSSQEEKDNLYGQSKKAAREILKNGVTESGNLFTGLIIPNVFGPFGKPFYNSVIATFCHQLTHEETPKVDVDSELNLIYVGELVEEILKVIDSEINAEVYNIAWTKSCKVSELLSLLSTYKEKYIELGIIPDLNSPFELNLFNTLRSFVDLKKHFPVVYKQHADARGAFTELIRIEMGGQVSFSTTQSSVTRGNHFHTRKIERFSVIKGKARIQLRKVGTQQVEEFYLDGNNPAFVDMPIWYTHNITNIGDEELYTVFWINEPYNPANPDTYFEIV